MKKSLLESVQKLNALRANIKATYKNKDENPQAWRDACNLYHTSYDALAFPGGLEHGLALLKKQDPGAIAVAIEYLAADPYYFRSGYNKERILRLLKNVPLTKQHIRQLQNVLLNALKSKQGFNREYGRLARKIQDDAFRKNIEEIVAQSKDERERRRAQKMLQAMLS